LFSLLGRANKLFDNSNFTIKKVIKLFVLGPQKISKLYKMIKVNLFHHLLFIKLGHFDQDSQKSRPNINIFSESVRIKILLSDHQEACLKQSLLDAIFILSILELCPTTRFLFLWLVKVSLGIHMLTILVAWISSIMNIGVIEEIIIMNDIIQNVHGLSFQFLRRELLFIFENFDQEFNAFTLNKLTLNLKAFTTNHAA